MSGANGQTREEGRQRQAVASGAGADERRADGHPPEDAAGNAAPDGHARPVLILGSASPRRLALMEQVGIRPDFLCPVDIDETPRRRETPRDYVRRMALEKLRAAEVMPLVKEAPGPPFLLTADTVVAVGRRILGKTEDVERARAHLKLLSGRAHRVLTAVCLRTPQGRVRKRLVDTKVRFKRLSRDELEAYLLSDEWRGKAGAYAIQGLAAAFVRHLNGSYSSVVGLPVYEVVQLLAGNGFPVLSRWPQKVSPPPML